MALTIRDLMVLSGLACASLNPVFAEDKPTDSPAVEDSSVLSKEKEKKSSKEQIEILKALFSKELKESTLLNEVFPREWLESPETASDKAKELEKRLVDLQSQSSSKEQDLEKELLVLKLQWLRLPIAEKRQIISELRTKEISKESDKKGTQLVNEATQEALDSDKIEKEIQKQVVSTKDEREGFLLKKRLSLERRQQELLSRKKRLGEIQQRFSNTVEQWSAVETEVSKALDSPSKTFIVFRPRLRIRLKESNDRVISNQTFFESYLDDLNEFQFSSDDEVSVVRDGDSDKIKELIQDIHRKSIDLNTSADLLTKEISDLKGKLLIWERDYRERLLEVRGRLINRIKAEPGLVPDVEKGEPIAQEIRTISSSTLFWLWSFQALYLSSTATVKEKGFIKSLGEYTHFARILLLVLFAVWLLLKRNTIVSRIQSWTKKVLVGKRRKWSEFVAALIDDLYAFLVLLFLGTLIIDFGLSLGFTFMGSLRPILQSLLIFFFVWGLTEFISPLLSQRRFRFDSSAAEVRAMEELFEFFPKMFLVFYLLHSTFEQLLLNFLNANFLIEVLTSALDWILFFSIYFGVWYKRESWRLVARKATDSPGWKNLLEKVHGKIWEPFILIFGGGLGVYFLAWRIIKARIGELEFAKSFQAMVSRALIERRKKQSISRVHQDRFPDGYLNSFNYETRALPEWHVERQEPMGQLKKAYESWNEGKEGTTVLLCGDRGVGKSELVYQFFRSHKIGATECKLQPGDTIVNEVCATISHSILESKFDGDVDSFCQRISELDPKVIFLENLENCILRRVDGFQAFSFLIDLIMRTSGRHLWILTFTPYAWTIAKRAVAGADCFSHYIHLSGMGEGEIQKLVLSRHAANTKLPLDFSELSLGDEKKSKKKSLTDAEKEERRRNLYFRILWDYTGGNPRQALYFWKTSLSFESSSVKVRLFDVPEQDVLENFRDRTLMLLSALVEHNGLTITGLSEVLNESHRSVRRWVEEVMPYGILFSFGEPETLSYGWHIESFWMSAVETYLEKRQLLFRGGLK